VLRFVSHQPVDFVVLVVRKFAYFWWLSPQMGLLYPPAWLTAYEFYAVVVYAFAIVGVMAILREGSPEERNLLGTLPAVSLTLALVQSFAYVEGRHRWGIEPLLLLLTARGLFAAAQALGSRPALVAQLRPRRQIEK